MRTPLIEIKKLSVSFSTDINPAVNEVSFTIDRGTTVGIVGESGSGKTLTALSIIGLLPETSTTSGELIYSGKDTTKIDLMESGPQVMQRIRGKSISMIFQEPMSSLNPAMKCGEQVDEVLKNHLGWGKAQSRKETISLFKEVNLPRPEEIYKSYPHQLSGGQRQRVMIAMAIACKPDLLVADEPTTALDVTVQKVILELLKKLSEKFGISILFISHDLGVIANIADVLLVMYKGEIVEHGPTEKLINKPDHPYTRGLMACRPPLEGRPSRLPTLKSFMEDGLSGYRNNSGERDTAQNRRESEILLKVKGLNTSFALKRNIFGKPTRELYAVKDVSFDLYKGETLGLVGESGCGKTSLGRTIIQLVRSGEGEILFNNIRINELKGKKLRKFRKNLQIIFQDPFSSLNPVRTVGDTIMEPMIVHHLYPTKKLREKKAYELLERVALEPDHFHRYPHQFSGGQRQRIGIARALAVEPEMIICDESVSALDVSVQAQILNLLNELKEDFGLTYLFISHDLAVVRYMSDRLMVMQNGQIVESGESDQIFNNPEKNYTKILMESIPRVTNNE